MSEELQFRTAVFGGFVKQDVMMDLERSAKEHAEKLTALRKELGEAKQAQSEGDEYHTVLEKRIAALESENQRLAADLSNREATLKDLDRDKAELEKLVAELRSRVDQLTPAAAAYAAVKDRTASIELEAHGRAQQIEDEGRRKAQKLREETTEWFAKMKETYDRLHVDVGEIMSHAARELEQAKASLDGLSSTFEGYEQELDDLEDQIETIDGPKLPDPLPLEDNL